MSGADGQWQRWDIFCTVVDNLGDIGVTWRLARQLAAEWSLDVRLWVDDLGALQRLWPAAAITERQRLEGVEVCWWRQPFPAVDVAEVVVEAFGCELPPAYRAAMRVRRDAGAQPLWINLEYLSAESWVEECHGLASPQPDGLSKYFLFPGFTERTGGLLRECNLSEARAHFLAGNNAGDRRGAFLAELGVTRPAGSLLSLFCYPSAPLAPLADALAHGAEPWHCLVPEGPTLDRLAAILGCPALPVGSSATRGALTVQAVPFLRQDRYDQLLWSCDLNLVRGEDSLVRAIWAGKPLLWHIYPQEAEAHWPKLDAFLDRHLATAPASLQAPLRRLWQSWNRGDSQLAGAEALAAPLFGVWSDTAAEWSEALAAAPDLAAGLVQFCANRV